MHDPSVPQNIFVISGGKVQIPVYQPILWILGYRSANLSLDFNPVYLDLLEAKVHCCNGTYSLVAISVYYKAIISISANLESFTNRLSAPTPNGFSKNPGLVVSYCAQAIVDIYSVGFFEDKLIESVTFTNVGLEFGGEFVCPYWK